MKAIEDLGRKTLATELNVPESYVEFIGTSDCSIIKEGALLLQYNIMKEDHIKYKSTVGFRYGW